jgi:ribulose-phosphate 3-epimerase
MTAAGASTQPRILPAILGADPLAYGAALDAVAAAGCEWMHVDVMDGQFTGEISFGHRLVAALAAADRAAVDVHLQTAAPLDDVETFVRAGARRLALHVEAIEDPLRAIEAIRSAGARASLAVNPETPLPPDAVLAELDALLLMTCPPGTSDYDARVLDKIREARERLAALRSAAPIVADGGIKLVNAAEVAEAGAAELVAASAVFAHAEGPERAVAELLDAARQR